MNDREKLKELVNDLTECQATYLLQFANLMFFDGHWKEFAEEKNKETGAADGGKN